MDQPIMEIIGETEQPLYTCSECNLGVIVLEDGSFIRGCHHESAPVNANMSADLVIKLSTEDNDGIREN